MQGARLAGVAFGNFFQRAVFKERPNRPIDAARTGTELPRLGLESIEFRQDFHRHCHGVFVELEQRFGVMN